jgi:hypothetical protein
MILKEMEAQYWNGCELDSSNLRFEFLTAVKVLDVLWVVTPCCLVRGVVF